MQPEPLTIDLLLRGYSAGTLTPADVVDTLLERINADDEHNVWIRVLTRAELEPYLANLACLTPDDKPLYGVPFAIKDNIDLAGIATTAGCPEFAYTPSESATVVQRLLDAGAIPLGKTNLDQFATGLVGTRSPYGVCRNAIDSDYISGGSSSGSAVATALGQVAFALGTDTAGSGRVPAAFNGILGLKPTRGLLSTAGVVPACATLDCVSIFSTTPADAQRVFEAAAGFDQADPFSRPPETQRSVLGPTFRFGVPRAEQLEFFGDGEYAAGFDRARAHLESLGGQPVELDFAPWFEAAALLYDGPWLAERYLAVESLLERQPDAVFPVTRNIIEHGAEIPATAVFRAEYRLRTLKRETDAVWEQVDVMLTPTTGTHYLISEVEDYPVGLNTNLGYYTNFMNLLDLAACAVPAGTTAAGLPFGVTLFAPAFSDLALLALAARWRGEELTIVETERLPMVVCGAHMSGLPLNGQLTSLGGRFLRTARTTPDYRFYALPGGPPERPGLVRTSEPDGDGIEVEVWDLPKSAVGTFLAGIPAPLGIGRVQLDDGTAPPGFLCEAVAVHEATDISALGGWRAYLEQRNQSPGS